MIMVIKFISEGLKVIHDKGFIHSDLHHRNLIVTESQNNLKFIRLGDLGLCKLSNEISTSKIYGILPYIAPEALEEGQFTQASDIYGVGIIMWVIVTGKIPFSNKADIIQLEIDILCMNLRPKIYEYLPQCYTELMEKCWHRDPSKHPSIDTINKVSSEWVTDLAIDKKTNNSLMFVKADQEIQKGNSELFYIEVTHSEVHLVDHNLKPNKLENIIHGKHG